MQQAVVVLLLVILFSCRENTEPSAKELAEFPIGDNSVFVNAQRAYLVRDIDSEMVVYQTNDGGKKWKERRIHIKASPDMLFAFGDTLVVSAKYLDSNYHKDTSYILASYNQGENWNIIYRTRHYIEDIIMISARNWQVMLRLDTNVDNNEFVNLHQLMEYSHDSLKTLCIFENRHFFTGILSPNYVYGFTSPDSTDNVTGVRVINNRSLAEKHFDLEMPYAIENVTRVHDGDHLYVPLLNEPARKAAVLQLSPVKIGQLLLDQWPNMRPGAIVVGRNVLYVSVYDELAKHYCLLMSEKNAISWRLDTSFNIPLGLTAPTVYNDTLITFDIDSLRRVWL